MVGAAIHPVGGVVFDLGESLGVAVGTEGKFVSAQPFQMPLMSSVYQPVPFRRLMVPAPPVVVAPGSATVGTR